MSRFGSLNSDAQMMNYYASKLESSYMIAKDEIARLTTMFRDAFHASSSSTNNTQANPSTFCNNCNIIMDPIVVRTKKVMPCGRSFRWE